MGLEACALCDSKMKQYKERAVMESWLCGWCAFKKRWDSERVGMGLKVCALCSNGFTVVFRVRI